ncbi:Iron-sulfur cluster-binding protein [hydrothermal vent metagenome]|uniref:Iron-sulfur cluster-binding protein n=1 Tax=hydrothermal vent metagenome TaxID=652676 RepID=A0A3B0SI53_9ZZZZ
MTEKLAKKLVNRAKSLGFDVVKITPAQLPPLTGQRLEEFVEADWHGDMQWLPETLERRKTPTAMWPDAVSAIVLGANYGPEENPLERLEQRSMGNISVYAHNRDYHDVIKGRLKQLAGWFAAQSGQEVKVFVDTAPLMEKPLAAQAGVGWQGKHTNLVSREFGSWLFLGIILTTADLPTDTAEGDHCGQCTACIDICPTNAIPRPYKVDARRCISYLTIEYDGHIDRQFRKAIGNRIYGCDDCLAVCPWNKFAKTAQEAKFKAREELLEPKLAELVKLDDSNFRKLFSGSPVKRIGRDRFVRNILIAIGNSGDRNLAADAQALLEDSSAQVRAMAVWAVQELSSTEATDQLGKEHRKNETDQNVLAEWSTSI